MLNIEYLKELMTTTNMSLEQLSEKSGISKAQLRRILSKKREIESETMIGLLQALPEADAERLFFTPVATTSSNAKRKGNKNEFSEVLKENSSDNIITRTVKLSLKITSLISNADRISSVFRKTDAAIIGIDPIVIAVIALIVVIIGAFVHLWNANEKFRDYMATVWEKVKSVFSSFIHKH